MRIASSPCDEVTLRTPTDNKPRIRSPDDRCRCGTVDGVAGDGEPAMMRRYFRVGRSLVPLPPEAVRRIRYR
jgi:hypothetical protein